MKLEKEEVTRSINSMTDWDVLDYEISRPPKEDFTSTDNDGMRQFVPGDYMTITIHLEKSRLKRADS